MTGGCACAIAVSQVPLCGARRRLCRSANEREPHLTVCLRHGLLSHPLSLLIYSLYSGPQIEQIIRVPDFQSTSCRPSIISSSSQSCQTTASVDRRGSGRGSIQWASHCWPSAGNGHGGIEWSVVSSHLSHTVDRSQLISHLQ